MPCTLPYALLTETYNWPPATAAAVTGYLYRESRCEAHPPPGRYYGAFQWDIARWRRAIMWMRTAGYPAPYGLEAQVAYAVREFLEIWPRTARRFFTAPTPHEALRAWDRTFGRGGRD